MPTTGDADPNATTGALGDVGTVPNQLTYYSTTFNVCRKAVAMRISTKRALV